MPDEQGRPEASVQFIKDGPHIPERLLQAHENGHVVFFCGSGISRPAGLPGFKGLVNQIFERLGEEPSPSERALIKAKQFDVAIGLLESRIVGERETVRQLLLDILTPDPSPDDKNKKAMSTHEALLTLAECRNGATRLVTTNFDRLFEKVIGQQKLSVDCFYAPDLPVNNRWDGLVYLHGALRSDAPSPDELSRLVLSGSDFGLAYFVDGWATPFVIELFRNYTVCFVGYSINDPVLRYMVNAFATAPQLDRSSPEMFAFVGYSKNEKGKYDKEWRDKGVTPILYCESNNHACLHKTLQAWAEVHRDGVQGKERIVVELARSNPLNTTVQDDFVGRMRWALSDRSGLPARQFAELNPAPSLDWLGPLFDSTTKMPHYLAHWLIRHLNNPKLLIWLANNEGQLHERLVILIERCLKELNELKCDGKTKELESIQANAPDGIPGPLMLTLWRLLLTGRVKLPNNNQDLFSWPDYFRRDGLTPILRIKLRELLTPLVLISELSLWQKGSKETSEPERIRDLVSWKIVFSGFSGEYIHNLLYKKLCEDKRWLAVLPELLTDFTGLLRDTLDLMRELGDARNGHEFLIYQLPIIERLRNENRDDWTVLIKLTWDAWKASERQSPERAVSEAKSWWNIPYPLFKRLSFFAAAQGDTISRQQALDWLLADECHWLWSDETEPEVMCLLASLVPRLDDSMLGNLEKAILAGPRVESDSDQDEDWKIWSRLEAIDQAGAVLSAAGKAKLDELSARYSQRKLTEDQHEELPIPRIGWVGSEKSSNPAPCTRRELVEWLKRHPKVASRLQDDWPERCRDNFAAAVCALYFLPEKVRPTDRLNQALEVWAQEKPGEDDQAVWFRRSWHRVAPILDDVPEEKLKDLAHSISGWMRVIASSLRGPEESFISLAKRILAMDHKDAIKVDDLMVCTVNHPVGRITQALLNWWHRSPLSDGQGLSEELRPIFTQLCDTGVQKYHYGRTLLVANLIPLFRIDPDWAQQNLLPLFDWSGPEDEARSAWIGFLWAGRLHRPLMEVAEPSFKRFFLETAEHYADLEAAERDSRYSRNYATLLTFAALDREDTFTKRELRSATNSLPSHGLCEAAKALVDALKGAGDKRADYWKNRIVPYFDSIWPKTKDKTSSDIAVCFGRLCLATGESFPEAFNKLKHWLKPLTYPFSLIEDLRTSDLCRQFPEVSLEFLDWVLDEKGRYPARGLDGCLKQVLETNPDLKNNKIYKRLANYLRRRQ